MKSRFAEEPKRATKGSAGYDFYAPQGYFLTPLKWRTIPTGVRLTDDDLVEDFDKWFMMIVPRSGLSFKYGFRIINTVAVIDQDYRGEIKLKVKVNKPYFLKRGERFAQGLIMPYGTLMDEVTPTDSRDGGFGSTGKV